MSETPAVTVDRQRGKGFEAFIKTRAAQAYALFDKNERTCVRFGMFPAVKMQAAQAAIISDMLVMGAENHELDDVSRLLAVGIMAAADAGPDKIIV